MNQEDQVQAYIEGLKEKAGALTGTKLEIAKYMVTLAESTYLRGDEVDYFNTERQLISLALETQQPLFQPILEVLEHLTSDTFVAKFRYIAEGATLYPYSTSYERRPFRTSDPRQHVVHVMRKLLGLFRMEARGFSLRDYLTVREPNMLHQHEFRTVLPDCIAYELDHSNVEVKQALHDIIYGDNQAALLTGEMIKGIFMSEQADAYHMVGELLIAARLQEGLRQSIVERMDEGTLEAYIYILKIILDNNLIRFSSVVRALGVWTGIGIEAANQRVATQLIEQAYEALVNKDIREAWRQEKNANKLYISLWATAIIEENDLQPKVTEIMDQGEMYQKIVAQYVLANSQYLGLRLAMARNHLNVQHPELMHWVVKNYTAEYMQNWSFEEGEHQRSVYVPRWDVLEDKQARRHDFDRFKQMLEFIPKGGSGGPSGVLDFVHYRIDSDDVIKKLLYLAAYDMDAEWINEVIALKDRLSPELRGELLSQFVQEPDNEIQRQFVFESLSDKSMSNRESALKKVKKLMLSADELQQMEVLLKLKTGSLRQKVIQVLLLQPVEILKDSVQRLLKTKSELQRLGALELLTEIEADATRADQFQQLKPLAELIEKPTAKEQKLLGKLLEEGDRYTSANGYGLFDPSRREPLLNEERNLSGKKPKDIFKLTLDKISGFLKGLNELVHEHRDHEYVVEYYAGYKDTLLVGTNLRSKVPYAERSKMKQLDQFPLDEVWKQYFEQSGLSSVELLQLYVELQLGKLHSKLDEHYSFYREQYEYDELRKIPLLEGWRKTFAEQTYPLKDMVKLHEMMQALPYKDQVHALISAAFMDCNSAEIFEVAEKAWASIILSMPAEQLEKETGMLQILTDPWKYIVRNAVYDNESFKRYFQTAYQFSHLVEPYYPLSLLSLDDFLRANQLDLIDDQEIYYQLMAGQYRYLFIRDMTSARTERIKDDPKLMHLRDTAVNRILEIELTRGELSTEVSTLAMKLERIEGMEHWVHLVSAMDQDTFVRGYIYSYGEGNTTRKETFSYLIKQCHPRAGQDEQLLAELLQKYPVNEKKLLEAAMYAPQWMELVAKHLDWEGLRSAAWYFHAHINEQFSAEKETIVAHYSPITPQDFNDGAFDIAWFEEAYAAVGEERFNLLYDCAKYISGGANHRRSQLFADAALGKLSLKEMYDSVADKRNKDHLLTYSLIPLAEERFHDVRERYDFIQKFQLQSKQFGAQRRASEGLASRIALGNLARNAGYADVTRLMWDMEARKLDEVKSYFEPHALDEDTTAHLVIDEEGQSDLVVVSKGKVLKSVPARFKKDGYIAELKELKSDLVDQYRRARQELERSMTAGTAFTRQEIASLMNNPVIRPLLKTLIFKSSEHLGRFDAASGGLIAPGAEAVIQALKEEDQLLIAHPLHLYQSGKWSEFQRDLFNRQERQPFKQVFRELYLPNEDELAQGTVSRRYAGYQIQPNKTASLLKGRQWTVSYEEGLQKVSYEHNLIANLYAMADWFSPADTEAPMLETVQFYDRRTYKPVELKDVPQVFFSEVMRDVDLVVSIAHVGGVDPEASLTTIEMRHVIVNESLRLLKIDNVRLDGNYARIDGELGEYAVHLGSGNVFKQATGALHIVPVHSQHRGRIFLPFLDEDPRTAEILSKIVLFAEDKKIKDPQILAQLQH